MKRLLSSLISFWQVCRPFLGPASCRFEPSCSVYAQDALKKQPLRRALVSILARLLRCQPFHPGGYDPVKA